MLVTRDIPAVRAAIAARRAATGGIVGLVPTMGALHAGHGALLAAARAESRTVVMSLFINPAQFGDSADLEAYPRDEGGDFAAAEAAGVDIIFAPAAEELYPPGFGTWVIVEPLGEILEGAHRPGHFRGVATIVLKLFHILTPDVAYFGQKDAQQVAVIRSMIRDLDLTTRVRVVPTVRDPDGLALSSRNGRLSAQERVQATALPRALATGDPARARDVLREAGLEPDYVEVLDVEPRVMAAAVRVGATRLIDNVPLEPATNEAETAPVKTDPR